MANLPTKIYIFGEEAHAHLRGRRADRAEHPSRRSGALAPPRSGAGCFTSGASSLTGAIHALFCRNLPPDAERACSSASATSSEGLGQRRPRRPRRRRSPGASPRESRRRGELSIGLRSAARRRRRGGPRGRGDRDRPRAQTPPRPPRPGAPSASRAGRRARPRSARARGGAKKDEQGAIAAWGAMRAAATTATERLSFVGAEARRRGPRRRRASTGRRRRTAGP